MLATVLDRLETEYGRLEPPHPSTAVGLLLWENVGYLVDDARRGAALDALAATVGLDPVAILDAPHNALLAVVAGMRPTERVARLRRVAELALASDLAADPATVLGQPLRAARRVLRRFPGVGDPSADRILLFGRHHPVLALDSNALRALVRLGVGEDSEDYQRSYRSAQAAAQAELGAGFDTLVRANLLLRRHGQELCRRREPRCPTCPALPECPFGSSRLAPPGDDDGREHPPPV